MLLSQIMANVILEKDVGRGRFLGCIGILGSSWLPLLALCKPVCNSMIPTQIVVFLDLVDPDLHDTGCVDIAGRGGEDLGSSGRETGEPRRDGCGSRCGEEEHEK